jgi:hypothetical protein
MLVPCQVSPQFMQKLTRDPVHDIDMDGARWEAYSYESCVFFWRIGSGDGKIEWCQIR